ncbi:hypothetical protein DYB25_003666 [Aphanomyces astaci]|uniref:TLC domain-containing protein n=1 Tax=Aphanomyces astaci TaxID=112090 RepID=A0A397C0S6_APHAT|nr:hypothetical protein DYB36_006118 [Aphanomyces astaci]RHY20085.1 hypothetical protein DYB25_003666 [Aphanomyces astaci]RHY34008.1 hypothetical protein DYB34_004561 [Aphanomyces astaci]RHY37890.1 hypothetical protein DYB38_004710 [Aphanomyces astaci]RHY71930.1 hypothetical protein DYB30_000547 [Aphanomyces astaci]
MRAQSPVPTKVVKKPPHAILDGLLSALIVVECVVVVGVLPLDLLGLLGGLLAVVAVAVGVTKRSFCVGGRYISQRFLKHLGDPLKKDVTMRKFTDQSWQLVIHASMTVLELYVLQDEAWWSDTTTQVRKDYLVMMAHHVVTIALVTLSFVMNYLPIGVLVLLLHDASDVPLDLLKMANYLKLEARQGFYITEVLFAIMLSVWLYCRVYMFPTKIIRSSMWESRAACAVPLETWDFTISWLGFNLMLLALYALHIWWTFLLLRLLYNALSNSGVHTAAEVEYEGGSDSDKED